MPSMSTKTDRELLLELHGLATSNGRALAELKKHLEGNGRPGVLDRLITVELGQRDCPAKAAFSQSSVQHKRNFWVAVMAALTSTATAVWALLKP